MRCFILFFTIIYSLLNSVYASDEPSGHRDIIVGVVPQFDKEEIHHIWTPLLRHISEETGLQFILSSSSNIPHFEAQLAEGIFDVAYMNPYQFIRTYEQQGYIPIIRDGSRLLSGIIVVKKDSDIKNINDLEGETVAFPSPNALGASLLNRNDLDVKGISIFPTYVSTHTAVYKAVAEGQVASGGGVITTFNKQPNDIRNKIKIIYHTRKVNPHPIAVHSRLAYDLRYKIQKTILDMFFIPGGANILKNIPMFGVKKAAISDYKLLESWNLERLD